MLKINQSSYSESTVIHLKDTFTKTKMIKDCSIKKFLPLIQNTDPDHTNVSKRKYYTSFRSNSIKLHSVLPTRITIVVQYILNENLSSVCSKDSKICPRRRKEHRNERIEVQTFRKILLTKLQDKCSCFRIAARTTPRISD